MSTFTVRISAPCRVCTVLITFSLAAQAIPRPNAFGQSGLDGVGFVNVVGIDPFDSGSLVLGGDVSGFHRSDDGGALWVGSNAGIINTAQLKIASVAFSRVASHLIYAAVGNGSSGGFMVSTDAGQTWTLTTSVPKFSGGNNMVPPLPSTHPRSTGSLIALDEPGFISSRERHVQGAQNTADR